MWSQYDGNGKFIQAKENEEIQFDVEWQGEYDGRSQIASWTTF